MTNVFLAKLFGADLVTDHLRLYRTVATSDLTVGVAITAAVNATVPGLADAIAEAFEAFEADQQPHRVITYLNQRLQVWVGGAADVAASPLRHLPPA